MKKLLLISLLAIFIPLVIGSTYVRYYKEDWSGLVYFNDSDFCFGDGTCMNPNSGDTWNESEEIWAVCANGTFYDFNLALTNEANINTSIINTNTSMRDYVIAVNATMKDYVDNATDADTWNSTSDIRASFTSSANITYDQTNGIFSFNMTCEQITGSADLCDGSDDGGGATVGGWNITGSYYLINDSDVLKINETRLNSTISALDTDTDTWNESTEIRAVFISSDNITYDSTTGKFSFNMTCEQITGGSGLCDGTDAVGAGGSQWDISGSYYLINDSDVLKINETRLNATIEALDTDTDTWNSSADIWAVIDNGTFTDTDTWNESSEMIAAVNQSLVYQIKVLWENIVGAITALSDLTNDLDFYNGSQINESINALATDTNTWNSTADIMAVIDNGSWYTKAQIDTNHSTILGIITNGTFDDTDTWNSTSDIWAVLTNGTFIDEVEINNSYLLLDGNNFNNDDWVVYDGTTYTFSFNDSKLATVYYAPSEVYAVAGTIDGNLGNVTHNDGIYDSVTLNLTEAAGSPALEVYMNFTGVDEFNAGLIRYYTSSLFGNAPIIQVWDYNSSEWEDYPTMPESLTYTIVESSVFDDDRHLEAEKIQMRIYKSSNGNTNNIYYIDWVATSRGFGTPAGEEVDPIWQADKPYYLNTTLINETITNLDTDTNTWNSTHDIWAVITNGSFYHINELVPIFSNVNTTIVNTNSSMKDYVDSTNSSMKDYVDALPTGGSGNCSGNLSCSSILYRSGGTLQPMLGTFHTLAITPDIHNTYDFGGSGSAYQDGYVIDLYADNIGYYSGAITTKRSAEDYFDMITHANTTWIHDNLNDSTEIYNAVENEFVDSHNITYDSATNQFILNISCETLTGSADLCDGSDDGGESSTSGESVFKFDSVGNFMMKIT